MTIDEAILHCEEIADKVADDYVFDDEHRQCENDHRQLAEWLRELKERREQPEIIHCEECIYYEPPHVENRNLYYEYSEFPKEAFDELGTGFVSAEYGVNVGGRCTRDYNTGYSEDKRVYISEHNFCSRAERRADG